MIFLQLSLGILVFILLSLLVFYLPGFLIIQKVKQELRDQDVLSLSFCLGLITFLLLAVLFGLTNLRLLTLPAVILVSAITVFRYKKALLFPWRILMQDKMFSTLLFLGVLTMGFINFPNGFLYKSGMLFWSSQGYDGTWHVALMEEIKKGFPPQDPIFAGERLVNYHYLGDIVTGEFNRIFPFFNSFDLHFRFFPILFSFMIIISVYALLARWQQSKTAGCMGVFFTVFVGSFGFIATFLKNGTIFGGETAFWASQLNTIISNPPHAIALSLLTTFFLALYIFNESKTKYWIFILILLGGFISGFKVSAGVSLMGGVVAAALLTIRKELYPKLFLIISLGIFNLITFQSITKSGSDLLILQPWWLVRTLIVSKLGLIDWELRRQTFLAEHNYKRVLQIELTGFLMYLIGNSGTRIIGFLTLQKKIFSKKDFYQNYFELCIFSTMIVAFVIPLLFLQKGVPANIIQFMQYFLLIFGFYAAISTFKLLQRITHSNYKLILLAALFLLSVPTVIGNFVEFYGNKNATTIVSNDELKGLFYLQEHSSKDSVVLTKPFNKDLKNKFSNLPTPIFAWYPTPYVSALTSRRMYLASEEMLDQTGYPLEDRLEKVKKFFNQEDLVWSANFLQDEHINYIYIVKADEEKSMKLNNLKLMYDNPKVQIYKVYQ